MREAVAARYGQSAGGEEVLQKPGEPRAPAGGGAEETRRPAAARGAEGGKDREGGKPGEPPPAAGGSFTARLLEAKRRALKRNDKKT